MNPDERHGQEHPALRQSPLHAEHVTLGAKMAPFAGWSMPLQYRGVVEEHMAVRERVGVFDVSHLGTMVVRGPGASAVVDQTLTNAVDRLQPGQAQYTLCCNDAGGVLDDLIIYLRSPEDVLLVPNAANAVAVGERLARHRRDGVELVDLHADVAILAVQGPRSPEVLDAVGLPAQTAALARTMSFVETQWQGGGGSTAVTVCRSGYTGEHGYELLVAAGDAPSLWEALLSAATSLGGLACGLGARDTLRTEMGYPLHGQDLSPQITPVQARLGWAVGWEKPAFDGRDALLAERAAGPARRLLGLKASTRAIPRPGMTVRLDGAEVGRVTSGTFSPTLRVGVGLALLADPITPGTSEEASVVQVDVRGRAEDFDVMRPPFVQGGTP